MRSSSRQLILGLDEAGYGPNIGPLVIACSAWLIDDQPSKPSDTRPSAESMLERLSPAFLSKPVKVPIAHIPLGDSKALYSSGDSVDSLSLGVRYWLKQVGMEASNFQNVLEKLAPESVGSLSNFSWYEKPESSKALRECLPSIEESIPGSLVESTAKVCLQTGLQFLGLAATAIDERRFNRDVERLGNKASLLSQLSLRLAADCLNNYATERVDSFDSIHVYCDKHGGRNRYQAILMDAMPELWFVAVQESAARSDYRTRYLDREMCWSFLAKGDRLFASALASMSAKWIREGLMARLNQFWQTHVPDLKPTAGYPVDAKRFREAIQPVAEQMNYPIADWWRFR